MQKPDNAGNGRHTDHRVAGLAPYELYIFGAVVIAFAALVAFVVSQRAYINFAETDFITFTISDATRVLNGEPTLSLYHPPLYALSIAGGKVVFGDWLSGGLAVSFLCGVVSLVVSFALFRSLAGSAAGWGAALALLGSAVFMGESFRAGNDMLFLCLFLVSCWLAVLALEKRSAVTWVLCGVFVGLALLTRSNALPLLLLIAAPVLDSRLLTGQKLRASLQVVGGLAVPLVAIAIFAALTGSRVLPANNLLNLGVTYFVAGADRASFDAALAAAQNYEDLPTLFLSDPVRIIRIYLTDFYGMLQNGLPRLVEPPLVFLIFPGIFILFAERLNKPLLLIGLVIVAEILLTNFKSFDARFYLFLIPLLGASIGRTVQWIALSNFPRPARIIFTAVVALLVVAALGSASLRSTVYTINNDRQIAALLDRFAGAIEPSSAIWARKPHFPFYTDSEWVYLPNSKSLEQFRLDLTEPSGEVFEGLSSVIRMRSSSDTNYVYFGEEELKYRPQLEPLIWPDQAPGWLDVVVTGDRPEDGTLYRLNEPSGGAGGADPQAAGEREPAS